MWLVACLISALWTCHTQQNSSWTTKLFLRVASCKHVVLSSGPWQAHLPLDSVCLLQRPSGAYIFFCKDKRADIKAEQPDLSAADILKELGALWKDTSDEDKKVFILSSADDCSESL